MLGNPAVVRSPTVFSGSLAHISVRHSSGIVGSGESQMTTPSDNQSGPFIQRLDVASSLGLRPLKGILAGLSLPAQCDQQSGPNSFRISETRFWTKGFQLFSTPRIQKRDTMESVKQWGFDSYFSFNCLSDRRH